MNKFKVGDRVRVIKYGHGIWMPRSEWNLMKEEYLKFGISNDAPDHVIKESEEGWFYDMSPEMVGQIGTVDHLSSDGGMYSLTEVMGKLSWYGEHQLELVESKKDIIDILTEAGKKYLEEHPEELEKIVDKDLIKEIEEFVEEDEFEKWLQEILSFAKADMFRAKEDDIQVRLLEQVLAKYKKFKKEEE